MYDEWRTRKKDGFYLLDLTASMMARMVPPVIPRSFPALLGIFLKMRLRNPFLEKFSQMSQEIPYFERGRKMSYEKSKKNNKSKTISISIIETFRNPKYSNIRTENTKGNCIGTTCDIMLSICISP